MTTEGIERLLFIICTHRNSLDLISKQQHTKESGVNEVNKRIRL